MSILVCLMLDEKLTNVDVASMRRQMQRSVRPKERKGENDGSNDAPAYFSARVRACDVRDVGIHVSFLLDEKMANIEVALYGRPMKGSKSPKQRSASKLWREK